MAEFKIHSLDDREFIKEKAKIPDEKLHGIL